MHFTALYIEDSQYDDACMLLNMKNIKYQLPMGKDKHMLVVGTKK